MSLLPNGPKGLDAHGCSVYGNRLVWEVTIPMNLDVVQSVPGTGEVERTGEKVDEVRIFHFIATTEGLCRAAVTERFSGTRIVGEILFKPIGSVDGEVSYCHK